MVLCENFIGNISNKLCRAKNEPIENDSTPQLVNNLHEVKPSEAQENAKIFVSKLYEFYLGVGTVANTKTQANTLNW